MDTIVPYIKSGVIHTMLTAGTWLLTIPSVPLLRRVSNTVIVMASKQRVPVSRETWKQLNSKKEPGDTFDDVLERLLEESGIDAAN